MLLFVSLFISCLSLGFGRLSGWEFALNKVKPKPGPLPEPISRGPFIDGFATFTATFDGTGYMRTVRPLGSCYLTSGNGTNSSEILTNFEIFKTYWTVEVLIFDNEDCEGLPRSENVSMANDGVFVPYYEKSLKKALELPRRAKGGFYWTTYLTESGCLGNASGWDVGITDCASAGGDRRLKGVCNMTDNSLSIYAHNSTSDYDCSMEADLLTFRPGTCSAYDALPAGQRNKELYQTNTCILPKSKPRPKSDPTKSVFESIRLAFNRLFRTIEGWFK